MKDDIDEEHDLTHVTESEYQTKIRHAEQLSSCPCTNCESRCWSTGEISECKPYRKWFDRQHGIRR